MPTQTITITATNDDGQESGGAWTASPATIYVDSGVTEVYGASFPITTTIPSGSTIVRAYFRVNSGTDVATSSTVNLQTQSIDPAAAAQWATGNLPSNATALRARNVGPVTWATNTWYFGEGEAQAQNIAADLQDLVDSYGGIASGERVNIFIEEVSGAGFVSFDDSSEGANDPQLFIEWTEPGGGGAFAPRLSLLGAGR